MLCPMPFEEGMPYALNFPANEVDSHKKVCPIIEYAFSGICLIWESTVVASLLHLPLA